MRRWLGVPDAHDRNTWRASGPRLSQSAMQSASQWTTFGSHGSAAVGTTTIKVLAAHAPILQRCDGLNASAQILSCDRFLPRVTSQMHEPVPPPKWAGNESLRSDYILRCERRLEVRCATAAWTESDGHQQVLPRWKAEDPTPMLRNFEKLRRLDTSKFSEESCSHTCTMSPRQAEELKLP